MTIHRTSRGTEEGATGSSHNRRGRKMGSRENPEQAMSKRER